MPECQQSRWSRFLVALFIMTRLGTRLADYLLDDSPDCVLKVQSYLVKYPLIVVKVCAKLSAEQLPKVINFEGYGIGSSNIKALWNLHRAQTLQWSCGSTTELRIQWYRKFNCHVPFVHAREITALNWQEGDKSWRNRDVHVSVQQLFLSVSFIVQHTPHPCRLSLISYTVKTWVAYWLTAHINDPSFNSD